MGIDDYVVLDRGNDLGGTWRDNSYPGAACDVPSDLYSYSFALNPDWTRAFPSQGEIWDYLRHCVDRFDVGRHLRFDQAVEEARWDEDTRRWSVRTTSGHEYTAPALIWATGSLSEPTIPDVPGTRRLPGEGVPFGALGARLRPEGQAGLRRRHRRVGRAVRAADRARRRASLPPPAHAALHRPPPRPARLGPAPHPVPPRPCPAAPVATAHLPPLRGAPLGLRRPRCPPGRRGPQEGTRPPAPPGARSRPARDAHAALRAGVQAPAPVRRLLPLAHAVPTSSWSTPRSPPSRPTRWWDRTASPARSTW